MGNNNTNDKDGDKNTDADTSDNNGEMSTHLVLSAARVHVTLGAGLPSATHWMLTVSLRSASTRSGTDRFSGASVRTIRDKISNLMKLRENNTNMHIYLLFTLP